jgi:DNA-binding MarR family transcriptional regulator
MSTPSEVSELFREVAGQSVLLSETVARHAGLSSADLEVLGEIEQHGPLPAGRLGELTGLSPAAVTGLIDRLERAGVVARGADPADRRRVLVGVAPGAARIAEMYDAIAVDANELAARFDERELAAIAAYLRGMLEVGVRHVARLESPPRRRRAG